MLRRVFLALLVWALVAGFMTPGEAASVSMDCQQFSVHFEGDAAGCGGEGMAAAACAVACHAGACLASAQADLKPAIVPSAPSDRPVLQALDHRRAPEIAPPKPFTA